MKKKTGLENYQKIDTNPTDKLLLRQIPEFFENI